MVLLSSYQSLSLLLTMNPLISMGVFKLKLQNHAATTWVSKLACISRPSFTKSALLNVSSHSCRPLSLDSNPPRVSKRKINPPCSGASARTADSRRLWRFSLRWTYFLLNNPHCCNNTTNTSAQMLLWRHRSGSLHLTACLPPYWPLFMWHYLIIRCVCTVQAPEEHNSP